MDVIMEEARTRGMRVWILDDEHFPTGYAAGRLKEVPKEIRRLHLQEGHWRIFQLIETPYGGEPTKLDYVNYLNANSVRVLIS